MCQKDVSGPPPAWQNEKEMYCSVCRASYPLAASTCARCGRPLLLRIVRQPLVEE